MYTYLLMFETEEKQVKECMMEWATNFGYNIQMKQWENMWLKELRFLLYLDLREF